MVDARSGGPGWYCGSRPMRFSLNDKHVRHLFLLPAVVWMLAFTIFPLLSTLWFSFHHITIGGRPTSFAGLDNFQRAVGDYKVHNSVKVTAIFVVGSVTFEIAVGMMLALLFNQKIRGRQFFRAIMMMPLFATPIAVGFLAQTMFYKDGPVNSFLGLLGWNVPWISDPNWAMVSILLVETWQWTPFCFLVFLAALQSLPDEIYEAAAMDYSSPWQIFRRLTLPLLQPVIIIVFLMRFIEAMKIFDFPYILTKGGPGVATEVYSLLTFRTITRAFNFGYASALALLLLVVVMVIVIIFFKRMREMYE